MTRQTVAGVLAAATGVALEGDRVAHKDGAGGAWLGDPAAQSGRQRGAG
ncbi:hypothetical protein [Nocardia mangyaensis]